MPVTIQKNKVKFKDPNNQGFITFDTIGSESAQEIQSKINGDVSNALKNLNAAAAAANASADAIAQAVSAAVAQGTDPNLALSGVPADAKATGDSITDLKSAIGNRINVTPWVNHSFVLKDDGRFIDSQNYSRTELIPIIPGTKIKFYVNINGNAGIVFYKKDQSFHSGYSDSNGTAYRTLDVPDDAYYIALSCFTATLAYAQTGYIDVIDIVDSLSDAVGRIYNAETSIDTNSEHLINIDNIVPGIKTVGGWITSSFANVHDGQFSTSANYSRTDYIPVTSGYSIGTFINIAGNAGICFYDSEKHFISGYVDGNAMTERTTVVPDKAAYVILSCFTQSTSVEKASIIKITNLTGALDQLAGNPVGVDAFPNLYDITRLKIGITWNDSANANRATIHVPVLGNSKYALSVPSISKVTRIMIAQKKLPFGAYSTVEYTALPIINKPVTTSTDTKYLSITYEASSALSASDFADHAATVIRIDPLITAVDNVARDKQIYDTFVDLVANASDGNQRFGDYLLRPVVDDPHLIYHKQDALDHEYYSVNDTVNEYSRITEEYKIASKNIMNYCASEEIDFTPQEPGFVRIIVGKSDDDVFFVAKQASNWGGVKGNDTLNVLETTSDFVNFTTLLYGDNVNSEVGIHLNGLTALTFHSVKQFADGAFLVAFTGYNATVETSYTYFYKLSSDMESITQCYCTNFSGSNVPMLDLYGNKLYDWHISIRGEKALVSTYGSRNPSDTPGIVWYSEDNGNHWKMVFQMTNHYQDGNAPGYTVNECHVHGVMLDPYDNRMFVIAGEENCNLFWSDKGLQTSDSTWNVIPIRSNPPYAIQSYTQVVNGYALPHALLFGSDNANYHLLYRLTKKDDGNYARIEQAHEILPNALTGTTYCFAEMFRKSEHSPLLICVTRENAGLTEAANEELNSKHKARVIATYDGFNFTEVWTDDTYGAHNAYVNGALESHNFSLCTRGMQCYILKNGDAVIKYAGRDYAYFGGDPLYSVLGVYNGCCKVKIIKNVEKYLT